MAFIRSLAVFHDRHSRSVACYFDPDYRDRFINAPRFNVHKSAHTPRPPGIRRGQFYQGERREFYT